MAIERVPLRPNPALFDVAIQEMQVALADKLAWLDHSFGRAERLVKEINGREYYTPNIYVGRNDYRLITPDDRVGNYSFFTLDEPQDMEFSRGEDTLLRAPFSLIVWVDMRKCEIDDTRNTEAVKRDILKVINGNILMRSGHYVFDRIYEHAENVFDGFTLDEIDNQYLMHPFCGWRFAGELTIHVCLYDPIIETT